MFETNRKLIDNLYYKGANPEIILCDLKQNHIIKFCYKIEQLSSSKNGIYVIKFTLEDRYFFKKRQNSFWSRGIKVNFIIDIKNQKINEIDFRYMTANYSGYIRNLSSTNNIGYLLDRKTLIYRNYIVGFLFAKHVREIIRNLSKKYKRS